MDFRWLLLAGAVLLAVMIGAYGMGRGAAAGFMDGLVKWIVSKGKEDVDGEGKSGSASDQ